MANPNVNERGYIYGKWHTGPNTWTIMLQGSPHFVYLLIGEEKAMLIDSFYGQGDLRAFVETITDKPVIVANTHGHFDHTGGKRLLGRVLDERGVHQGLQERLW